MITFRQFAQRAATALLVVSPGFLEAQGAPRRLAKPEVEFAEPFSRLVAVRELRDGRVIVADSKDKTVQVLDLKGQKATKIGREGSGPGEYGLPTALVVLPADTTLVFDPLNSRYLRIGPDAKPGATFRLEDGAPPAPAASADGPPGGLRVMAGLSVPRATDAKGYLYFEGSPISFGPNGPVSADSAPVMRYDRKTYKYDTLTFVTLPKNSASVQTRSSGGNQNVNVRVGGATPFPSRDQWTVLPNGTVVVARVKDYHLDVIGPNKQVSRGAAVPFTPVKVGEAEKAEYRKSQVTNAPIAIMRTNENGRVQTNASTMPPAEEPKEWPTTKPPFGGSILAAPNGDVWVARSRPASDEIPRYDIFSPTGKLTGQVLLPKNTRLVGFGNAGAIYTVRTDEDDLQYLQRFRG
jgi:6-bladed beta-propeller